MKLMIATALAIFAVPAIAQDTPAPAPAPTTAEPAPPAAPATDPAAAPAPAPTMGPATETPAPAPQASYPLCSKTVTDGCRERNSRK